MINETPQKTGILKFFNGVKKTNGPRQSPPMPQPNPNNNEPIISLASILPLGSLRVYSNTGFFLKMFYKITLPSLSHDGENNKIDDNPCH